MSPPLTNDLRLALDGKPVRLEARANRLPLAVSALVAQCGHVGRRRWGRRAQDVLQNPLAA